MCAPAAIREEHERSAGTGWTPVVMLRLEPGHRTIGVEVRVSGPADLRLLSPMGAALWTNSPGAAGVVGTSLDAAFEHYRLEAKAGTGTIQVTGALTAR